MSQYASIAEANAYFTTRVRSGLWATTSTTDKDLALGQATRAIDRLAFAGDKTDPEQELEFPRGGDTDIPNDIKFATFEVAYAFIDGHEAENDTDDLAVVSQGYSSVRATYDRKINQPHMASGIPSIVAWRYLLPYLVNVTSFGRSRVS